MIEAVGNQESFLQAMHATRLGGHVGYVGGAHGVQLDGQELGKGRGMSELVELDRFGHDEAWWLGTALVERCRAEALHVTILIKLGRQRVFHAALSGTSADNDN